MSLFTAKSDTRADIEREIHRLSAALEHLKQDAARDSDRRLDRVRQRMETLWDESHLGERGSQLAEGAAEAGRQARECARQHPLTTVALAAGAVALLGYWLTRR